MQISRPFPVAFLLVALAGASFSRAPEEDPLYQRMRELAERLTVESRTPGVAVARLRDGRLAWAQGIGHADLEAGTPVTPETVFNVGSISKVVAAWGAMRLVERGVLDLDAPVWEYVERWRLPDSELDAGGVTLRRLLSHTAGLSLHGYPGFRPGTPLPSLEESLSGATGGRGSVHLVREPGSGWEYSGGGYTLTQLLIEEASGQGFAAYMKEEVLEPLGMLSSDFRWTDAVLDGAATPYDEQGRPFAGQRFTALAAAGLQTTVLDLARFGAASLAPAPDPQGAVLGTDTISRMREHVAEGMPSGLGYLRMGYYGLDTFGHAGSNDGWESMLSLEPVTADGIVLLSNGSNGQQVLRPLYQLWVEVVSEQRAARLAPQEADVGRPGARAENP